MKCVIQLLALIVLLALSTTRVSALESEVQLSITPKLCNVDVVDDGNNQIMHLPSADCEKALPWLPASPGDDRDVASSIPSLYSQSEQSSQLTIRPQVEGTLSPIVATTDRKDGILRPSNPAPTVMGVGLALGATIVGIDLALFEFRYSRSFTQWIRRHALGRLSKG